MIPVSAKRFKQILKNNTILTPEQIFTTLGIKNEDFITFNELCDISRKETIKKLYALRDMCNLDFANYDLIDGIAYDEKTRPILTLLFQPCAVSKFKITETVKVPNADYIEHAEEKKQKEAEKGEETEENKEEKTKTAGKKKKEETLPAYRIDEDVLDYLLTTKVLRSKLDQFLIEKHRPLLELYKEFLNDGTFYPDFQTCDCTGNFGIASKHENYLSLGEIDSIVIPEKFGDIVYEYSDPWTEYRGKYTPITEDLRNVDDAEVNSDIGERVFFHKALLPDNYSKPQK